MIPDLARRMPPASFVSRLVLAMVAVPVLVALGMALILSRAARHELDDLLALNAGAVGEGQPLACAAGPSEVAPVDAGPPETGEGVACFGGFFSAALSDPSLPAAFVPSEAATALSGAPVVRGEDGLQYAIVGALPFTAVYAQDRASFLDSVNRVIFVTAGGSALLAGACAFALARQIGRPLRRLQSAAREVGAGNLAHRVEPDGTAETQDLADAFNQMAADLTRAEDLRRTMTANVAHELRTPLANVAGYLDAIEEEVLLPDAATLAILRDETASLVRLVNDLEQLALDDAGALTLQLGPVALDALVEQVVASFAMTAEAHGVTLMADVPPALPEVSADPHRLAQVLRNLVSNALRHTPIGGAVVVRAAFDPRAATIEVADTGEGIPAEHLDRIFEPFYRVDPSRVRATGGAGLGLAVARRLVEAHGGSLLATSRPGHGSRFTVRLPRPGAGRPGAAEPEPRAPELSAPRAYAAPSL